MKRNGWIFILILACCTGNDLFAQSCNCGAAFKWATKAFEENDAGFRYILDQKGNEAYQAHNNIFLKKVSGITNPDSCMFAMRQWAKFFRVGHFGFIVNPTASDREQSRQNKTISTANRNIYHSKNGPSISEYDANTFYLRIPSFDSNYKIAIDSTIRANMPGILKKKNLIIDIRDNGGGDDASFKEIIPIIYTNPIRNVSVSRLSTPNNNKFWQEYLLKEDLSSADRSMYQQNLDRLNANPGKFVTLWDSVYLTRYEVVHPLPENVAIIINEKNGSTAEQFLLAAKQSRKVKLFGTTTKGELDISNMYSITSADGKYTLWYCMSKSLRVPEYTIDNKGIEPDFFIDKAISTKSWLPYVAGVLSNW